MTHRRRWLLLVTASLAGCAFARPASSQPRHKVSAAQLQRALAERFPMRYPVAGLVDFQVQEPQLRFLPEQNRLGAELAIVAAGPALRRAHSGTIDLDFGLRYEPSDSTLRAHQIRVQAVRLPSLSRDAAKVLEAYARASAERAMLEVVLHTFKPQDLALADTMGLEPTSITVVADGLVIGLAAKRR